MNILLLASHSVAEYDDIRMFTDLGYEVFCPGGYQDPRNPGESLRPALPDAPYHPDLIEACEVQRRELGDPGPNIDWAKARLHDDLIDWADVIICHHFPERWIGGQWDRIRSKDVIWRTCGQSDPRLEEAMRPYAQQGMAIVRYSPAERRSFELVGAFAGQDALIRFGKYPDDYGPWVGDYVAVGNITQHMQQRGDACGYPFWAAATEGLPIGPAGPGSEVLPRGLGALDYRAMLEYLRRIRAYLYTGTRPASYTLGLIEAMMSGVPTVSMGQEAWSDGWGGPGGPYLFEAGSFLADSIVARYNVFNIPSEATRRLRTLLEDDLEAEAASKSTRERAIELFDVAKIGQQWVDFLGQP